jgi:hypothetical protein
LRQKNGQSMRSDQKSHDGEYKNQVYNMHHNKEDWNLQMNWQMMNNHDYWRQNIKNLNINQSYFQHVKIYLRYSEYMIK